MKTSKIVQFSDFHHPQEFSQPTKNGEKIVSQSGGEKIVKTPGNMGLPAIPDTPPRVTRKKRENRHLRKSNPRKRSPQKRTHPSLTYPPNLL
jgi:hypothetical protein